MKWANNNLDESSFLTEFIKINEPKLKVLVDLRNYQEHPVGDKATVFQNYTLNPDMTIKKPIWFVKGEETKYIFD